MKKTFIILIFTFIIISTFSNDLNLKSFDLIIPNGMIKDKKEKKIIIEKKINQLEISSRHYWGKINKSDKKKCIKYFREIWNNIKNNYIGFRGLDLNIDTYEKETYKKLETIQYYSDFYTILTRTGLILREGHTMITPEILYKTNFYVERIPLLNLNNTYSYLDISYCVDKNNKIIVTKILDKNNPLRLETGDIILGYNGILWKEWIPKLLKAEIPIIGVPGSSDGAIKYNYLKSCLNNFHLFEQINIKKYSTGEIKTIDLKNIKFSIDKPIINTERIEVLKFINDSNIGQKYAPLSGGILENTNIGYININYFDQEIKSLDKINEWDPYNTKFSKEFYSAVQKMLNTDGLIIDLRDHKGGMWQVAYKGLLLLINNKKEKIIFKKYIRDNSENINSFIRKNDMDRVLKQNKNEFYKNPIILITGPECISGGDFFTAICSKYENITIIGNHNNGAFAGQTGIQFIGKRKLKILYIISNMKWEFFEDEENNLLRRSDFIDIFVRQNQEDAVNGVDTVIKKAIELILN